MFYLPAMGRLFTTSAELGELSGTDEDSLGERIDRAARATNLSVARVRDLVANRPVQWDTNGTLAGRVIAAFEAREAMTAACDLFNLLGEGEPLERVAADLAPDLRRLLEKVA
ncbi:MAG: hypothetical protein ACRDZX_13350 [Acidimicrobiales bacterium]